MKRCYDCKKEKPLDEFYKDKSRHDGLDCRCKECNKKRDRPNPIVYEVREKEGDRFYIGSTTRRLTKRISSHFDERYCLTSPFTGLDKGKWSWTILETCETKAEARSKEKCLLAEHKENENCLNKRF